MKEILKRLIKSGSVRFIDPALAGRYNTPRPVVTELIRLYVDNGDEWYCWAHLDSETNKVLNFGVHKRISDLGLQDEMFPQDEDAESEESGKVEILSRGGVSLFRPFKRKCTTYGECRDVMSLHRIIKDYIDYFNNERPNLDKKMTPAEYERYLESHEPIRKKKLTEEKVSSDTDTSITEKKAGAGAGVAVTEQYTKKLQKIFDVDPPKMPSLKKADALLNDYRSKGASDDQLALFKLKYAGLCVEHLDCFGGGPDELYEAANENFRAALDYAKQDSEFLAENMKMFKDVATGFPGTEYLADWLEAVVAEKKPEKPAKRGKK